MGTAARRIVGGRMVQSQPGRSRRFRLRSTLRLEDSLSLAAFVMSLAITLINVYYAMRGSEIAVDPPAQLILYRDGEGDASVLTAAVRFDMINVSDGYGDVLKQATISFDRGRSDFDYQGTVRTVLAGNAAADGAECELGMRCLQLPGLYVVERSDEVLEAPAGAARAFNLSFPLVSWNCAGEESACRRFGTFAQSSGALPAASLAANVRLRFHSDGERRLRCTTAAPDLDYLRKVGWLSLPCREAARG